MIIIVLRQTSLRPMHLRLQRKIKTWPNRKYLQIGKMYKSKKLAVVRNLKKLETWEKRRVMKSG